MRNKEAEIEKYSYTLHITNSEASELQFSFIDFDGILIDFHSWLGATHIACVRNIVFNSNYLIDSYIKLQSSGLIRLNFNSK